MVPINKGLECQRLIKKSGNNLTICAFAQACLKGNSLGKNGTNPGALVQSVDGACRKIVWPKANVFIN